MSDTSYTVTADQIREYCIEQFGWGPEFGSDTYLCPTRDWFLGTFGEAWSKTLDLLGLQYQEGAFDCQSFTLACVAVARICHQRTPDRPDPAAALAVGGFGFSRWRNGALHKVCIAFHKTGDKLSHSFLEPQSGKEATVYDPEETKSCMKIDLL